MRNIIFAFAALALLAPTARAQQIVPRDQDTLRAERYATVAADALRRFDYAMALRATDDGLKIRADDPWLLYDRGAALAGLGRTDEAVETLARAEQAFAPDDTYGRAVAIYRAALALEMAGRCTEAKQQFARYAQVEHKQNADLASDALRHARLCVPGGERQNVSGRGGGREQNSPPLPRVRR